MERVATVPRAFLVGVAYLKIESREPSRSYASDVCAVYFECSDLAGLEKSLIAYV